MMAEAGWSGSSSANRWLTLSVVLPCFLATNPKSLVREQQQQQKNHPEVSVHPDFAHIADMFVETYFTEPPPSFPHLRQEGIMIKLLKKRF